MASASIGQLFVDVDIKKGLATLSSGMSKAQKTVANASKKIGNVLKSLSRIAIRVGIVAGAAFSAMGIGVIKLAMAAEESESLFSFSFGKLRLSNIQ